MGHSIANASADRHPVLPDIGKKDMARIPDIAPKREETAAQIAWNEEIGAAIQRAVALCGWSNKEAAAKVGVDDAEFGKWLSGARRPQMDRLFAVASLREPLVTALAQMAGAKVTTRIEFEQAA